MLNFFVLGVMASSIVLAAIALFRERNLLEAFAEAATLPRAGVPFDSSVTEPATLDGFDPSIEALLVQLPIDDTDDVDAEDFTTRPATDGRGQELLYRDRVLLHLPDISPQRQIELYIAPLPA